MEQIFQIPAEISKIITLSHKSARLYVDTQENLSDEQLAKLMSLHETLCWATFLVSERQITAEDIKDLPEIKDEADFKSPSQRQRAILHVIWKKTGNKMSWEEYYIVMMNKIAEWLKEKYLE